MSHATWNTEPVIFFASIQRSTVIYYCISGSVLVIGDVGCGKDSPGLTICACIWRGIMVPARRSILPGSPAPYRSMSIMISVSSGAFSHIPYSNSVAFKAGWRFVAVLRIPGFQDPVMSGHYGLAYKADGPRYNHHLVSIVPVYTVMVREAVVCAHPL